MNGRMVGLAVVAVVAVAGLAVLGAWRAVSAIGPDVNNDGYVRSRDISEVVRAYGLKVPTAPLPVREQNLDADGNIKVHEQGVVSVSASAPLPVEQQGVLDVNVLSEPQSQATHLVLYETVAGDGSGFARTSFADTSGCSDFIAMTRGPVGGAVAMHLTSTTQYSSPDGTTSVPVQTLGALSTAGDIDSSLRFSGTYPYFAVAVNGNPGASAEVWLYCR